MAEDHWAGTFAAARDGDRIMREDPNEVYDRRRCRVCGCEWCSHSDNLTCSRYRPTGVAPDWVTEALARHERARERLDSGRVARSGFLRVAGDRAAAKEEP
jgi:hypothetical protein